MQASPIDDLASALAEIAAVALMFASSHAKLGDAVSCMGMLANAALCAAHGRLAAAQSVLGDDLDRSMSALSAILGIEPLRAR